jgi:hypothetical protein
MELVETARQLGRLDELAVQVEQADAGDLHALRSQTALWLLIAVARGDDEGARPLLVDLYSLASKIEPGTPEYQRYPEAVALAAAVRRPALVEATIIIADMLVEQQRKDSVTGRWESTVRHLAGRARWQLDQATANASWTANPNMRQWSRVDYASAGSRSSGRPASAWRFQRGEVEHFPGNSKDGLYLNVPLRGDFEVSYEQTMAGYRENHLGYHGLAICPRYDKKSVELTRLGHSLEQVRLGEHAQWGPWVESRLVVKNGSYTAYIDGRQVYQTELPEAPDPWVFLRTAKPELHGGFRDVRITGSPAIPDELELASGKDLTGWRSSYFNVPISTEDARWQKRDDEIVGGKEGRAGSFLECLLQYHRPMLEDGVMSYEFYYEPAKTEAHPALDRLAFLLRPDGVRGHWITDAGYERTGLKPDAEFALPDGGDLTDGKGLPLKARDWNRMVLTLRDDEVTLNLNDQDVARYKLEATNQRFFGFFRYCDLTDTRVRNVVYRGEWPKTLPPVEDQELAYPPEHAAAKRADDLPASLTLTFNKSVEELRNQRVSLEGPTDAVQVGPEGTRFSLPPGIRKWGRCGYKVQVPLAGDFRITASIDSFNLQPPQAKQARVLLEPYFRDPNGKNVLRLDCFLASDGGRRIAPVHQRHRPDGSSWQVQPTSVISEPATRLRITRRGSRASYWYATEKHPEWCLLDSFVVGQRDVDSICLVVDAVEPDARAEAVFKELEIRAERFLSE